MIIKNLTPLLPANVVVVLDDESEHDLFVMIHLLTGTVIVPDEKQYELIQDSCEQFTSLVQKHIAKAPVVEMPQVPRSVMQRVKAAQKKSDRQREALGQMQKDIEQSERFPNEEAIAEIIKEQIENSQKDNDAF
jgi:hypothetical protein